LLKMLCQRKHGHVLVTFHAPIAVRDVTDRKVMAQKCEDVVRSGLPALPDKYKDV